MPTPESKLMVRVKKRLEGRGYFVLKNHGSIFSLRGLPDLLVSSGRRHFWVELKVPKKNVSLEDQLSPSQRVLIRDMRARKELVYIVGDLDQLEEILEEEESAD